MITSDNESEEHIILNACGGRLKSKDLLCNICNPLFGDSFDASLAASTNHLANLLLIERDRGFPQPIRGKLANTKEVYDLQFGGNPRMSKPIIKRSIKEDKVLFSVTARDERELKKILLGLKKKHPLLNIEEALANARYNEYLLDEAVDFKSHIGGKDEFKSITKTAINYFIFSTGDRKYIKHLLPYLLGEVDLDVVWMHYPSDNLYIPDEDEVSHVIHLVGNPHEKLLYSYIELFNTDCYIIKLSTEYEGLELNQTYVYDLLKNKQLNKNVTHTYNREQIIHFLNDKDDKPFSEAQKKYSRVMQIADRRQMSKQYHDIISTSLQNAWGKYPEDTKITEEMIGEAVEETMKLLGPWIIRNMKMNENFEDKKE